MFNIIGYIIIVVLTFGGYLAATMAGVYVGMKQDKSNKED
jgi:hypothetical protein